MRRPYLDECSDEGSSDNATGYYTSSSSLENILSEDSFTKGDSGSFLTQTTGATYTTDGAGYNSQNRGFRLFDLTGCCVGEPNVHDDDESFRRMSYASGASVTTKGSFRNYSSRLVEGEDTVKDSNYLANGLTPEPSDPELKAPEELSSGLDEAPDIDQPPPSPKKIRVFKSKKMTYHGFYRDDSARPIKILNDKNKKHKKIQEPDEELYIVSDNEEIDVVQETGDRGLKSVDESNQNALRRSIAPGRRVVYARHHVTRMCVDIDTGETIEGQLKRSPIPRERMRKIGRASKKAGLVAGVASVFAVRKKKVKTRVTNNNVASSKERETSYGNNEEEPSALEKQYKEPFKLKRPKISPIIGKMARGTVMAGTALATGAVVASQTRRNRKKKPQTKWEEAVKRARTTETRTPETRRDKHSNHSSFGIISVSSEVNQPPASPNTQLPIYTHGREEMLCLADSADEESLDDAEVQELVPPSGAKEKNNRTGLLGAAALAGAAAGVALSKKATKNSKTQNVPMIKEPVEELVFFNDEQDSRTYHLPFDDEVEVELDGDANIVFMPLRETYDNMER